MPGVVMPLLPRESRIVALAPSHPPGCIRPSSSRQRFDRPDLITVAWQPPVGVVGRVRAAAPTGRGGAFGRAWQAGREASRIGRAGYFARPEVAGQLREARRAERQVAAAGRAAERQSEQQVRRQAKAQAAQARGHAHRTAAASSARRRRRSVYEAWLDEHDAARTLTPRRASQPKRSAGRARCRRRRQDRGGDRGDSRQTP